MSAAVWLSGRAARSGRELALAVGETQLDFASLDARARSAAACLLAAGLEPGASVALLLPNGLSFAVLVHAVARCAARLVVLNARLTAAELASQLRRARPALLLHAGELETTAEAAAAEAGVAARQVATAGCPLCGGPPEHGGPAAPAAEPLLHETFAVLFTSGTGGAPKAVPLSHANFWWSAHASALRLGSRRDDRWLACLPLFHVGGLSILLRSVLLGGAVQIHERFDAEHVSATLDADDVTLLSLVPTMLSRLLEARGRRAAPPRLRALLLGGAAASPCLLERARALGFPVRVTYGLTEAASQVATATTSSASSGVMPPLFGTALRITDDAGRSVASGAEGEIEVRGPTLMRGYLDEPAAARATLRDGWLRTGDLGRLAADGGLVVLDRRSDLVVSGGENVSPVEVEAALLEHPAVAEAAVAGLPDADLGRRVGAWVVARPGACPDPVALRAFCRERLAGYKVPKQVRVVPALPRTASGKLLRAQLEGAQSSEAVWNTESLSRQRVRSELVSARVKPSSSEIE